MQPQYNFRLVQVIVTKLCTSVRAEGRKCAVFVLKKAALVAIIMITLLLATRFEVALAARSG